MKSSVWQDQLQRMRERLIEPVLWFPFPALIGFGLVIILRGQLLTGFNHRVGTRADVVNLQASPLTTPGIWLSIYQEDEKLILVTDDHQRFSLPLAARDLTDMKPLIQYLKGRSADEAFKATLSLEADSARIRAVLAVDQKLKYIHIRPILFALAEARISNYGFETRIVH